jgi:hypothetical protein
MRELTKYESEALREIKDWENREPGLLDWALDLLGKPVAFVYANFVPDSARQVLEKAVLGALELLKDAAYWSFSEEDILEEARSLGIHVSNCRGLARFGLERLDPLARRYFTFNKLMAALEGAGCGLGGPVLIAVDIPALFTLSFRAIQQIGSCYGFDMRNPNMSPVVLGVISAGSSTEVAGKSAVLADMHIAAKALAKNWTSKKVAERTKTGAVLQILKQRTQGLPKEIANNVTKRKLGQLIPLAGAIVGAGFNYWFLSNVCRAAYMVFRAMHLQRPAPTPIGSPSALTRPYPFQVWSGAHA